MSVYALEAHDLRASYTGPTNEVLKGINEHIETGTFTVILGPNGSGKSTFLMTLAKILAPTAGEIHIAGQKAADLKGNDFAKLLALMPQQAHAPEGIRVWDLVSHGRHPHRSFWQPLGKDDLTAVDQALAATGCTDLANRRVLELSGGQRQRVWIAMALAQQAPLILLDEPIAHLDLSHALDVLDIAVDLVQHGQTVVAVLHDINLAARYADKLIVVHDGCVVASGPPAQVITENLIRDVFGVEARVFPDPETGTPYIAPRAHHGRVDRTSL
ncbi:ABC transporter ATP-binding protein [Timonella sp. A28]|uniref:ABC transporter ATP-binding protein n=1 Tax=Timonella sp. A28 TaxID=3442640 RepID=UPI003EBEC42D